MLEIRIKGNLYRFGEKLSKDDKFLTEFLKSEQMQENYQKLELTFPEEIKFVLYRKELVSNAFIEAYYDQNNFIPFESFNNITLIDPIANPAFTSSGFEEYTKKGEKMVKKLYISPRYSERLQKILYKVFKEYGKLGLDFIRKMNVANIVNDLSYYLEEINKAFGVNYVPHELTFNNQKLNINDRVKSVLESKALRECKNANILSSLVYLSELLYVDGIMISNSKIKEIIETIEKELLTDASLELDQNEFLICCFLLGEYHLKVQKNATSKKRGI